jgi:hypothetical protein
MLCLILGVEDVASVCSADLGKLPDDLSVSPAAAVTNNAFTHQVLDGHHYIALVIAGHSTFLLLGFEIGASFKVISVTQLPILRR